MSWSLEPLLALATAQHASDLHLHAGLAPRVRVHGELRVLDDDLREVPHDGATLGEICVRGNVVMEGYYNDPKATADAFRGGWFHSGDAAVVHPDGYAEIRDRFGKLPAGVERHRPEPGGGEAGELLREDARRAAAQSVQ